MNEKIKNNLEELFNEFGQENCEVSEVKEFSDLIILECIETVTLNSGSKTGSEFTIIYKNGVFFNSHFEDLEELYFGKL